MLCLIFWYALRNSSKSIGEEYLKFGANDTKYDNKKHTLSDKLNTHPLGMNLLLQAGYGCLGFNARFALTSLFEKNKGPELYPASIGIGWYW